MRKGIFYRRDEVLRYLQTKGPASSRKLAKHWNLNIRGIQTSLKQLRELKTVIYICDWERHALNGDFCPVYAVKEYPAQRDVPKPAPLTNTQKCRRYQLAKKGKVKNSWITSIFSASQTAHETQ